ncbi:MAG: hypothetical protein DMD97_01615 [Candidatus Rokuibacteriota bacterium]|nr:MAG: hypothetical protein DMD97_01615 [Candidatus Rokubacteria bacterium]
MKLSDLMSDFVRHLASYRGYSPRTTECYSIANDQFITFLRNKSLTDSINSFNTERPSSSEG